MEDASGLDFRILATSIDSPFETVVIVDAVRINLSRHWPGYGAVSWQPGGDPESMVREWPGARVGPAGRYFWDMGGSKWMHHGLMTLRIGTFADPETGPTTAVTVAGYPATYQEERDSSDGVLSRTWIVDIEGRRVFIIVLHGVGAADGGALTAAQVEEADAIVESMRHETSPDGTGSRLTFTLPVGWDSG